METDKRLVTLAVSVALQDAGEATRAVELIKAVRDSAPESHVVRAVFFSHGSKFDALVAESGFELLRIDPPMEGEGYLSDLKPTAVNFVGSRALGAAMIRGELKALEALKPDFIVHGFWPFVSIARRIAPVEIPAIRFLPLPLHPAAFAEHLLTDIPDALRPLTLLPAWLRRRIARAIPANLIVWLPIYRQKNLRGAAADCGWHGKPLRNLFEMLEADLTLINDYPGFYEGMRLPESFQVTGPLYAAPRAREAVDPAIERIFHRERPDQVNLYCSMGSSATPEFLTEAAHAIASLPDRFHAVLLAPKAVCPLQNILSIFEGKPNLYATDRFVPAVPVSEMADITISHGGQGTVQTALAVGTPIVGFAMQPEQQINLDHAVLKGAAIRIPKFRWNRKSIQAAIEKLATDPAYRESADLLRCGMTAEDGRKNAAAAVWGFIIQRQSAKGDAHAG